MKQILSFRTILILGSILLLLAGPLAQHKIAYSQTSEDLQQEIEEKQKQLEETQNNISSLQEQIEQNKAQLDTVGDGIPFLEAQIQEIDLQLAINTEELVQLEQTYELQQITLRQLEIQQKKSIDSLYKQWKMRDATPFNMNNPSESIRITQYSNTVLAAENLDINSLATAVSQAESDIANYESRVQALNDRATELAQQKVQIEQEIAYFQNTLAQNNAALSDLQAQMTSIEGQINDLLAEQQEAARREAEALQKPPAPTPPNVEAPPVITEGGFFFAGRGRDLYQGHGVGMSQWGAYGAAESGMSAESILSTYYTNVRIEARPGTINVQGYGVMDANTYAAGLGEVPSKACGTAEQAADNPQKYVTDNPNSLWDCWPEEAIKAQVIAARSYGLSSSQPICTTAACQVYQGHTEKQWAADETQDLVIVSNGSTHNGQIIRALYSSDNSQGVGTANNDTIFQSFSGDGTPYSYLRAVNDTGFARTTQWTYWQYNTQGYDLNTLYNAFIFSATNPNSTAVGTVKNGLQSIVNSTSGFTSIRFERDSSERVKKVWLTKAEGGEVSIGGWWFKNFWNTWQADIGRSDFLYSQTFYINYQ